MVGIGIDLGYGRAKAVAGSKRVDFPSRWGLYEAPNWGMGHEAQGISLDSGPAFVVGDEAALLPSCRQPLADGRLADRENTWPLLAAALLESGVDGEIVLGSGLPLAAYSAEAEEAKEALQGRTFIIRRGRVERHIHIRRVILRPQGVGAAMYLYHAGLLRLGDGLGVVVDIGSRTTDILTISLADFSPVKALSDSLDFGIGNAVAQMASSGGKYPLPLDLAEKALTQPVSWHGKQVGGPQVAAPILASLASRINDGIAQKLRGEAGRVAAMIPVGGGAILLGAMLQGFPTIQIPGKDAGFANALGYALKAQEAAVKLAG